MYNNDFIQVRGYLTLIEQSLFQPDHSERTEPEPEAPSADDRVQGLLRDLDNLVFKLRAHSENEHSETAIGLEAGMSRAADMVENLIRRHTSG